MLRRGTSLVLALHMAMATLPLPCLLPATAADSDSVPPLPSSADSACRCCPAGEHPCGCCTAGGVDEKQAKDGRPLLGRCCCDQRTVHGLTAEPWLASWPPAVHCATPPRAGEVLGTCDSYLSISWAPDPPPPRPGM